MALLNRCPECGSNRVSCHRPHRFLGLLCFLLLIFPWVFWMLLSSKVCKCKACGAKWKA